MLIAAVTMDLAGRKVLLYVSGECLHCNVCLLLLQPLCPRQSLGRSQVSLDTVQDLANGSCYTQVRSHSRVWHEALSLPFCAEGGGLTLL